MSMGRPRHHNKDLPPGLYCYPGRSCYIQLGDMKPVPLRTQDRSEALTIYWEFRRQWDAERTNQQADIIADRLQTAVQGGVTVKDYAATWREKHLKKLVTKDNNLIGKKTQADYERMLRLQVEKHETFETLAVTGATRKHMRAFLAKWIGNPKYYNNFKSLLSRMFNDAIAEGLRDENPLADVTRRPVAKRKVYVPMDHYLAITKELDEWEAYACDLIYLISHRPGDVLRLKDQAPWVTYGRRVDPETGIDFDAVIISFTATKNDQAMEVIDDVTAKGGIEATLQWFREWKKKEGFDGRMIKHFICYPTTSRRRSIGKPISVGYLSRKFAYALLKAGFDKGTYVVRDLRKKGLTDEARIAGKATNKGGHKTQTMREYYVVGGLPQRARNNLTVIRGRE